MVGGASVVVPVGGWLHVLRLALRILLLSFDVMFSHLFLLLYVYCYVYVILVGFPLYLLHVRACDCMVNMVRVSACFLFACPLVQIVHTRWRVPPQS